MPGISTNLLTYITIFVLKAQLICLSFSLCIHKGSNSCKPLSFLNTGNQLKTRNRIYSSIRDFKKVLNGKRALFLDPEYLNKKHIRLFHSIKLFNDLSPYVIDGAYFNNTDPFGDDILDIPISREYSTVINDTEILEESNFNENEANEISPNWHRLHRNSYQSTPLKDGNIEWDDYDPKLVYFTQKDDNDDGNPYYNGSIRSQNPSYINPKIGFYRTGRKRDEHRRTDTGLKQRLRWGGPSPWNKHSSDISRGNWTSPNDNFKDMLVSVEWERNSPHIHDTNYFKKSIVETGWGDDKQAQDSYWDIQFIGSIDTFPQTEPAGMNFTIDFNWVPFLKKKYPRGYQPIKSKPFSLGGVDPVQLWFWPAGCGLSSSNYSSVKLITRPGWSLPFPLKIWASSEYGTITHGPFLLNSGNYTTSSINFCRFLTKSDHDLIQDNNLERELVLGPSGNVQIGVGIADESWEWDDGTWDFENWLKKQTAVPDNPLTQKLPTSFTHSEWYENFKYKYIPDKHFSNYLPNKLSRQSNIWNRHAF